MPNRPLILLTLSAFLAGCASVGPKRVHRDRLDYGFALSETVKEQTILNIVKCRYLDWPTFLDVSQIVAGYSLKGSGSVGWMWYPNASSSNNLGTNVSGTYTESPTVTYAPLVGNDFASVLLDPLEPQSIFAVAAIGWKADRLFELTLNSINGKTNAQFVGDTLKPADSEFLRMLDLFRDLQASNVWALRRQTGEEKDQEVKLFFRVPNDSLELQRKINELKNLLGLDPAAEPYTVTYGDTSDDPSVIAVESRTVWEVFWELQRFVDVPAEDLEAGRVARLPPRTDTRKPVLRIRSGSRPPANAFAAVPYRNTWFWIDDSDLESKHTLSIILLMFTLSRPGAEEPPQLVIPTR